MLVTGHPLDLGPALPAGGDRARHRVHARRRAAALAARGLLRRRGRAGRRGADPAAVPDAGHLPDVDRARAVPLDRALQPGALDPRGLPRPDLLRQGAAAVAHLRWPRRWRCSSWSPARSPSAAPATAFRSTSDAATIPAPRSHARRSSSSRDVSLCYRLAKQRIRSFKEYAIHLVRGALTYEQLWALRDVSFEVAPARPSASSATTAPARARCSR